MFPALKTCGKRGILAALLATVAFAVTACVKGWMKRPTHRAGILEPSWQTQGIGIAISHDYRVYVTEDFC
jgi:uncharacterized protein YkwD